jgi:hypothetical protein
MQSPVLTHHQAGRPPAVKVTGIYEDLSAGLKISRLCARLTEECNRRLRFQINIYSFDVLALPAVAIEASRNAEQADAVIVSSHRSRSFPMRIRKWIDRLQLRRPDALVQLFDSSGDDSPAHCFLDELACSVQFLDESATGGLDRTGNDAAENSEFISVAASDEEELCETLHFGINE